MDKNLINHTKEAIAYVLPHLTQYKEGMDSLSARVLMLGTAMVESSCMYRKQIGGGDARGLWQVEKETYQDNIDNYIVHRESLWDALLDLTALYPYGHEQLTYNDTLACAHGRIWYYRQKARLPQWNDAKGLADYHKKWYNSSMGATDIEKSVVLFEQAIKEY